MGALFLFAAGQRWEHCSCLLQDRDGSTVLVCCRLEMGALFLFAAG